MKCPICNKDLDIYDIDKHFEGNFDKYADCDACHHSFIFYYRYFKLWKYIIWNQYFDENDKQWYSKDEDYQEITVNKMSDLIKEFKERNKRY